MGLLKLLNFRRLWFCLLCIYMLVPGRSWAAVPVVTLGSQSSLQMGDRMGYRIDTGGHLKLKAVLDRLQTIHWQLSRAQVPNFGLDAPPVWMAVTLHNAQDKIRHRLLKLGYPMLDKVDLYLLRNGQLIRTFRTGDHRSFNARPIPNRNFVFPIDLPAGGDLTLLLRAQSLGSMQLPLSLWTVQGFFLGDMPDFALQVAFFGIMAALAIYNLLLFLMLRRISYLWYVGNTLLVTIILLTLQGLTFQYLWPDTPWLNNQGLPVMIALDALFVTLFVHSFLNIRRRNRTAARVLEGAGVICVTLVIACCFLPYSLAIKLDVAMISLGAPAMLGFGAYLWWRGDRLARLFTLAWAALLSGHTMVALDKLGVIPDNVIFNYAPQIGAVLEVLLLSFALGSRIRLERRRRFEAQQRALRIQQEANEQLEAKVAERTEELVLANEKLRELSAIDGLTHVKNRLWFNEAIASEWRKGCREVKEMGLMMIDVDHFKRINDTYGHQCGDACLQHMASILRELARREGDEVARYGGEEFVILLPRTSLEGCVDLAEKVRRALPKMPLRWGDGEIAFTISVGVAACMPQADRSFDDLIRAADEALYEAKASGRNRVVAAPPPGNQEGVLAPT